MNDERYQKIMSDLGMPNSRSLLQALQQVANEVGQQSSDEITRLRADLAKVTWQRNEARADLAASQAECERLHSKFDTIVAVDHHNMVEKQIMNDFLFTVVLIYPDYIGQYGECFHVTHVRGENATDAIDAARIQAMNEFNQAFDNPDTVDDPLHFAVVAVFPGHQQPLKA